MITLGDYFGRWVNHVDATPERRANAENLLAALATFEAALLLADIDLPTNPITKSCVSGASYGGFRPQICPVGADHSAHKDGLACDLYDPDGKVDQYIDTFTLRLGGNSLLEECGLYREAPASTPGWCHLSIKAPPSGKRTFQP